MYEQEDGELESKVTTVPQSKTKHYEQQDDSDQNGLIKESYKSSKMQQRSGQNHAMVMSMTEKKLNNYLQQAKYLIGSNGLDKVPKKGKRMQNYSIDNNEYLNNHDSSNSSKVLFNAGGALGTSSSNDKSDPLTDTQMKQSFLSLKKGEEDKKIKKQNDYKMRSVQLKDKKLKMLAKIKTSDQDVFDKVSTHRYSDQTKSTFIKTPSKGEEGRTAKTIKSKQKGHIQPAASEFVIAEEQWQQEGEDHMILVHQQIAHQIQDQQLLVLNVDDGSQQMDLGNLKSLNKRQASKTEVGPPLGGTLSKHKKNQASVQQRPITSGLGGKIGPTHKKTSSYFTQSNNNPTDTRNSGLSHKHITATTSPVFDRMQPDKVSTRSSIEKKKIETRNTIGKKMMVSKTIEIKEDQNEDEENDKKNEVNKQISPSSQSSFSFQPKFFKPTTLPMQNLGKHSVSMEDHLTTSTLQHTQQILKKDLSKKL